MIRCGIERGCNRKFINSKLWSYCRPERYFLFPEHLSSPPVFSGVRVTRSLVLYVLFCSKRFLRFLENHSINIYIYLLCRSNHWILHVDLVHEYTVFVMLIVVFSFGHYVVCSSIYTDSDFPFGIFKLFFTWSESALKPWPV